MFRNESVLRSVLLMIYSPCKYIASRARCVLSEILWPNGKEYPKCLLEKLNVVMSSNKAGIRENILAVMYLMSLACFSALPNYQRHVLQSQRRMEMLMAFMDWCLSNNVKMKRSSEAPHLQNSLRDRTCWVCEGDWDGEDAPLLFSLWEIAELIHQSPGARTHQDSFAGHVDCNEAQLVGKLQGICSGGYAPGPKWYAAYILSCFGLYGFPSELGKRVGRAFHEEEYADLELIHRSGESFKVHGVILLARCPSLLSHEKHSLKERTSGGASVSTAMEKCEGRRKQVHLSAHVDHQALSKLLEYAYLGYLRVEAGVVKKLNILAKHCNMQYLLQMLRKKQPTWGAPLPSFDLTYALAQAGYHFSDVILEAKEDEMMQWACSTCSLSTPHMHAHKVVLWSICDYLQALLQSGMQESHSGTIKIPVGWEALVKLVNWFYSDELPKPVSGCLWDNFGLEEKMQELHPYIELSWLTDLWLLRDLHEYCSKVVLRCLDSAQDLSLKAIQIAANLCQWELVEAAANYMAPSYNHLRNSGEFESLDKELVDMVRAASVRLSRRGDHL